MANMGKQHISSRPVSNLDQRKSIFEQSKFPQPSSNITPSPETMDLSGYRQPQPGEMIANVMDSLSTSKSASPPNYLTGKQLPAPKRQEREVNMASVNQLKALPRQSNLSENPIQKQEENIPNQTGLPDNLKAGIENLSGYSLDNVRVHYNSPKPAQLQALAYTKGTDIHVAPGQEEHLPHEAWHFVQQMQGRVKPTMQMKGVQINDDEGLEKEADVMGGKVGHQKGDLAYTSTGKESDKNYWTVARITQTPVIGKIVQANGHKKSQKKLVDATPEKFKKKAKERMEAAKKEETIEKQVQTWLKRGHSHERHSGLDDAALDSRRIPLATTFISDEDLFMASVQLIKVNQQRLNAWYQDETRDERITLWVWKPEGCRVKGRKRMERPPEWHSKKPIMPPHPGYEDVNENVLNIVFGVFDRNSWNLTPLGLITCFPGIKDS